MATTALDFTAIKDRQRRTWAAGDYQTIAARLYPTAETLCDDAGVGAGDRVLDVACATGNVALAVARRHAQVVGVDYVPAFLERARQRAEVEGFAIEFGEADTEALPFPDASFDIVLSAFGAMFSPDQERAARELLRVCRPGGRIGLANWTPASGISELFRLSSQFVPPPPGLRLPEEWGTAERLQELFGQRARALRLTDRVWRTHMLSAKEFVETYRGVFGSMRQTFAALDGDQAEAYAAGLRAIVHRHNRAADGRIAAAFAYVTAVVDVA